VLTEFAFLTCRGR